MDKYLLSNFSSAIMNSIARCFYSFECNICSKILYQQVPPEFKYRISGLKFSTNYTVRLYSYDEKYRKGSKEDATTFFVTPRCLTATNYNFTLCGEILFRLNWSPVQLLFGRYTVARKVREIDHATTTKQRQWRRLQPACQSKTTLKNK